MWPQYPLITTFYHTIIFTATYNINIANTAITKSRHSQAKVWYTYNLSYSGLACFFYRISIVPGILKEYRKAVHIVK